MKFIIIPKDIKDLDLYKNKGADTFIFGLEDYCINYPSLSLEKIKELSQDTNIFVAMNKNIFNSELEDVKDKLVELSKLPILGVLYYDLGILNIVKNYDISIDLVWHQTHMVTNYNTCNYYYDKGVKYGYLANEITLEEILDINQRTSMNLMVQVFGYPIMSHSRRSLLSNYFKSIDKNKENRIYHLKEKEEQYLLKENKDGASILFGKLINGTRPLFDMIQNNISYGVLDVQEVDFKIGEKVYDQFSYILNHISDITSEEKEQIILDMNQLIGDSTNFFYKKTVYKVKKGDSNEKK